MVEALPGGPQRFNDLLGQIPGIAANIFSERLKRLEREGLLIAPPYSERPPRAAYQLTAEGAELAGRCACWRTGRARHADQAEAPRHPACGTLLEARWYCPTCDPTRPQAEASLTVLFTARPVPDRPAARRRSAVDRQMPGRAVAAGLDRRGTVAQRERHDDQARPPLVPVLAALRVAPPARPYHCHMQLEHMYQWQIVRPVVPGRRGPGRPLGRCTDAAAPAAASRPMCCSATATATTPRSTPIGSPNFWGS